MSDKADAFWLLLMAAGLGIFAVNKCTGTPDKPEQAAETPPPLLGPLPSDDPAARPTGAVYLTSTKEGAVWSLNADSVRGDRKHRIGWVTVDHSKDKTVSIRTSRTLYSVDCETTATRTLSSIDYNKDGTAGRTFDGKPEDPPTYYPPESIAGGVVTEMCLDKYGP